MPLTFAILINLRPCEMSIWCENLTHWDLFRSINDAHISTCFQNSIKFTSERISWNICHYWPRWQRPLLEPKSTKPYGTSKPNKLNDANTAVYAATWVNRRGLSGLMFIYLPSWNIGKLTQIQWEQIQPGQTTREKLPVNRLDQVEGRFWSHGSISNTKSLPQADYYSWDVCPSPLSDYFQKNIEIHTTNIIVSWPNPKQWVIVHSSDLMMIIRHSIYSLSHHKGDG